MGYFDTPEYKTPGVTKASFSSELSTFNPSPDRPFNIFTSKVLETFAEIYQLIIDLANKGKVVLMVSSEMPELLGVCDRILVMSGGRLAGEVDAKNTTQEEIMSLAAKYV